ncbi:MAG: 7-carboxy-7-deazaguanine synthase [Pseudomonadota bacterium]
MTYSVKELFYTLQGEGFHAGRPAVFCRFAGCNLWSGLERDRASAICTFCDTNFVGTDGPGGGKFKSAEALASEIASHWPQDAPNRFVVCTGGEPLMQLDTALIEALHDQNFEIAIETNGTLAAPPGIDWICVSPKAGAELRQASGHELKLVFPQFENHPDQFIDLPFDHRFLQPMDSPDVDRNTASAVAFCKADPRWRLSVQTHKAIGIP